MLIIVSMATVIETILRTVGLNMITLRENEKILRTVRRHWAALAVPVLLPLCALVLYGIARVHYQFTFFGYAWQALAGLAALGLLYFSIKFFIWRRNALIVTDQRVVHHTQKGLFSANTREVLYQDITDVMFRKKGLAALLGGQGTLILSTSAKQRIVMERVPDPDAVVELINRMRGKKPVIPNTDAETPTL